MPKCKLFSMIDKAIFEYKLIEDGDKILIGASGGKDSTALIEYFAYRKKQNRDNFEFKALHIGTEISSAISPELIKMFESWNVDLEIIDVDVLGRLKENKKMNCWWCSTQRRTELNNYAIENGYNKIALGHHLDDILETLLMNMLNKGELSTMPPRLKYNQYPVTIIRPLCMADEQTIIQHANNAGYICDTCTCNYQDNSGRKKARSKLQDLTQGSPLEKRRIFESLKNIRTEYLP